MSFLAPLALLLGGLAAPLVALYFLKLRRRRVTVPSVLLWQAFEKTERLASPFERFRRNLLLWLQLAVLLLLVLAAARPYLETRVATARSVVLVLDRSASMGATDLRPTRFDAAVQAAGDLVDGLGPSDEAMLILGAVALAASTRLGTMATLAVTSSVFVLGMVGGAIAGGAWWRTLLPNLQYLWVSDGLIRGADLTWGAGLSSSLWALTYTAAMVALAAALFRTRDVS